MSDLLNNGKPRKKLLDRGPKIVPAQEFKLESTEEIKVEESVQEEQQPSEKAPTKKTKKQDKTTQVTTVRVMKSTRSKLNALVQMGRADSVDVLVDILLDEYIENNLVKEEKKTFNLVFEIIQKRER